MLVEGLHRGRMNVMATFILSLTMSILMFSLRLAIAAGEKPTAQELLDAGLNAYRAAQYDDAIAKFRAALEQAPQLVTARFWLGMCYYRTGQLDAAEREWEAVLAAKPDSRETQKWLSRLRRERAAKGIVGPPDYSEALAAYRAQRFDEAASKLQQVVQANPRFLPARFWLGVMLMKQGKLEEAKRAFREVLKEKPTSVETALWMGRLEELQERWDEALCWYRTAVGLNPHHREAVYEYKRLRGILLARYKGGVKALQRHASQQAVQQLAEAAKRARSWIELQYWYGRALLASGQPDEAIKLFKVVLQHRPTWTKALIYLAEAYAANGQPDEAAHTLAMVLRRQPRRADAQAKFAQLIQMQPLSAGIGILLRHESNQAEPLVTFANRTGAEVTIHWGEREIKLAPGAEHKLQLPPALYTYRVQGMKGFSARGKLFLWSWHDYKIIIQLCQSQNALLNPRTDVLEEYSSQKFPTLVVNNATEYPVSVRLHERRFVVPPGDSIEVHLPPGEANYGVSVQLSEDFTPSAAGRMTLPPYRIMRWRIQW